LWNYTLRVTDRNYLAHANLAMTLAKEGKSDDAIRELRASEQFHAYPADQLIKIGLYEQRNGHIQGAIDEFQKVSAHTSDPKLRAAAWSQAGSGYVQMGNYQQASQSYENALQQNPNDVPALVGSAMLAARNGDFSEAVARLNEAMKVKPTDIGFLLLADALRHAGRLEEAQAAEAMAQKISPQLEQARKTLPTPSCFSAIRQYKVYDDAEGV